MLDFMQQDEYLHGARRLVGVCTHVRPDEAVLVVIDRATDPIISEALSRAAEEAGATCTVLEVEKAKTDSGEPPRDVAKALKHADVVFAAVNVSMTHTHAVRAACERGARVAALTQWVPEMLLGGGIDADFPAIEPRVLRVAKVFDEGSTVRVTTAAGTDMTLNIRGRVGTPHAKTGVIRPGQFHPIPDIEAPVSLVSGSGTIVCDASIPYLGIGVLESPVRLTVEDGAVTSIEGGWAAERVKAAWDELADPTVYNLAELGVGMNPECRLTGRMLDDEGVATTCHFGIGTSDTLGGVVKAPCHFDFVLHDPTIVVDDFTLMMEGSLLV